jgi:uncharacterized protein (TIGR02284 family)
METTNQKSIDVLNNLLEINNDRIEGYNTALKETKEPDLKNMFSQFAETSQKCKRELTAAVRNSGGTPIEGTLTSGKLYRAWMDVKAALTNKDRKTILNSCEFGDDVAVKNYEDALKNTDLETNHFSIINNQYSMIRAEHDKIKNLRDVLVSIHA